MSASRWTKIQELFQAALERDASERDAFLAEVRDGDQDMEQELRSLISAHEDSRDLEDAVKHTEKALLENVDPLAMVGRRLGSYQIRSPLGQGGMSTVYLATRVDDEYEQRVAVKLLKPLLAGEEIVGRFRQERQILANLSHPHIAKLLDGGATEEGRPYFVMELIEGVPIDRYCDKHRLPIAARLELFATICEAVDHAHRNLIIHRDLKPGNVLVNRQGVPTLLDFGIAKILNPEGLSLSQNATSSRVRLLTPRYASPEQVRGRAVSAASDIYSLGVMLYELVTGHAPYRLRNASPDEIERVVRETVPEKPSKAIFKTTKYHVDGDREIVRTPDSVSAERGTSPKQLNRGLRGDLDNIVMMAIRKEPERRYQSAIQFAEDLSRFRRSLPVVARGDTLTYRWEKFLQRNKTAVAVGAVVSLVIAGLLLLTLWQALRMSRAYERADLERDRKDRTLNFLIELFDPSFTVKDGNSFDIRDTLEKSVQKVAADYAEDPAVQAELLEAVGMILYNLGIYDRAVALLEKSLEIRLETGNHDLDIASNRYRLGLIYQEQGDSERAEDSFQEVLSARKHLPRKADHVVMQTMCSLATLLRKKGELREAEPLYRKALQIGYRLEKDAGTTTSAVLNGLANLYQTRGQYDRAEPLYREALQTYIAAYGETHVKVLVALNNLALLEKRKGNYNEAEELYRRAMSLAVKLYGEDHYYVSICLNNAAALIQLFGEFDLAESHLQRALAILDKTQGPRHPTYMKTLNNLGRLAYERGEHEKAETLLCDVLDLRLRVLGEFHPDTARTMCDLALVLKERNAVPEAESMMEQALAVSIDRLGASHPQTGEFFRYMGMLRSDPGHAERCYRRALAIDQKTLPENHPHPALVLGELGNLLTQQGRPDEAEPLLTDGIGLLVNAFPQGNWRLDVLRNYLGACYTAMDRFLDAEPLLLESHALLEQRLGLLHPRTITARKNILELNRVQAITESAQPRGNN